MAMPDEMPAMNLYDQHSLLSLAICVAQRLKKPDLPKPNTVHCQLKPMISAAAKFAHPDQAMPPASPAL
jgi:hypothetical protein